MTAFLAVSEIIFNNINDRCPGTCRGPTIFAVYGLATVEGPRGGTHPQPVPCEERQHRPHVVQVLTQEGRVGANSLQDSW